MRGCGAPPEAPRGWWPEEQLGGMAGAALQWRHGLSGPSGWWPAVSPDLSPPRLAALQRLELGPSPIAPPPLPPAHRLQLPCRAAMGQQKRHRYEQQGLPGTGVPAERYGPERPGPTLETIEQGQLQVEPLGPLFEGAAVEGGAG